MPNRFPLPICLFLCASCTSPSVVEVTSNLAPFRESVAADATSSVVLGDFQWVQTDTDRVWLVEEPEREPLELGFESLIVWDSAQTGDGVIYVATDQGLRVLDRELLATPVADLATEEIRSINAWRDTLWLEGEEETLVVSSGQASILSLDGQPLSGPVYQGDALDDVWVIRDGLQRIRWVGEDPKILETAPTDWARWGARSGGGTIWAARGEQLSKRVEGIWEEFLFPERILGFYAHPESEIVWLRGETSWFVWQGDVVRTVDGLEPDAEVWDVDSSGRIVLPHDGGVERWGAAYTVVVKGIEPDTKLEAEVFAEVIPSFSEDVFAVETQINGEVAEGDDRGVSVEPVSLGDGAHEFRATVTYTDETVVDIFVPFTVGEFESPSWEDDIRPIFKADCGMCHDGDSESVYNTAESWRADIDNIVQLVSTGSMPLERDPLTPVEVAVVRAWRVTGMLP